MPGNQDRCRIAPSTFWESAMSARSIRIAWRGLASLVLVGLPAVACSSGAATSAPAASTSASTPPSSGGSTGVVVNMATTSLGPVLTSASGLTLYVHAGDTPTSSTCTGGGGAAPPPPPIPPGPAGAPGGGGGRGGRRPG